MLQCPQRLFPFVLVLDRQPGEIGGMNRKSHISLGCQLAKRPAPFLLPGETLGERELEAPMPLLYKGIEELGVVAGFRRQM